MTPPIAAIYCRKSTEQKHASEEDRSVAVQEENARAFAASKGWRVDERYVFRDDGVSGADLKRLKNRTRMLTLARQDPRPFQIILVRNQARFSRRDGDEVLAELKALARAGVQVWFYSTGQPFRHGGFLENVGGFVEGEFNAEHRRRTAKDTTEALRKKFELGHHLGGRVFGYDLVDVMKDGRRIRRMPGAPEQQYRHPEAVHVALTIDEAEAQIVRRIFSAVAQGTGLKRLAQQLNVAGTPCPRPQQGRPAGWAPSSLHALLRRDLYRGIRVWNRSKKKNADGDTAPHQRSESEWMRRAAPELQIVSDGLWQRTHATMHDQRARYDDRFGAAAWGRTVKHLLAGLLTCACCGATLEARSGMHGRQGRVTHYGCSAYHRKGASVCANALRVRAEIVEEAVIEKLSAALFDPGVLDDGICRAVAELTACQTAADEETTAAAMHTLDVELRSVAEQMATAGRDDLPVLLDQMRRLGDRRRTLVDQREYRAQVRRQPVHEATELLETLRARVREQTAVLTENPAEARDLIKRMIVGRLVMTPHPEEGFYRFTGEGTVAPLLEGVVPQSLASPPGFEPGFQP